jgi:hypothetical protein
MRMRAMGPGSISSVLKTLLDGVYVLVWVGVVGAGALSLLALLLSFNPALMGRLAGSEAAMEVVMRGPVLAGGLAVAGLSLVGVLVIVDRLRRIFETLRAGDPFHPDNVRRLRVVGLTLAGLELVRYFVWALGSRLPGVEKVEPRFSLTAWFSVLVVFVLAEVFREGARLRREAELTI